VRKQLLVYLVTVLFLTGCEGSVPELGLHDGELTSCPNTPNCVNSQAVGEKQYIEPIFYTGTQQEARVRLLEILQSEKRIKILKIQKNYIRAEFTSALFGFVDDVEFYFPEEQTGETIIDIRSASRLGYSDLGTNRKRIEQIRNNFFK